MSAENYLFDANAVIDLVLNDRTATLLGEMTLELMFYEATNTVWKFAAVEKKISREEGAATVTHLSDLQAEMDVLSLQEIGPDAVYTVAWDHGLTAYDAAYVAAAVEYDCTLVTSDRGIHENTPSDVQVLAPDEI